MDITEVRIKLMDDPSDRLQAFCSITFDDCFVIRDLKIIDGANGPFVAMPSRKLTSHCPQCGCKNHLRAAHCNQCGLRLKDDLAIKNQEGRKKLYADIAHPINSACREILQQRVIEEFNAELERSKQPGYISQYDEFFDDADNQDDVDNQEAGYESLPTTNKSTPTANTQIQPAATEPRPPHSITTKQTSKNVKNDGFGDGIF